MIELKYSDRDKTLVAKVPFAYKDQFKASLSARQRKWIALSQTWDCTNVSLVQLLTIIDTMEAYDTITLEINGVGVDIASFKASNRRSSNWSGYTTGKGSGYGSSGSSKDKACSACCNYRPTMRYCARNLDTRTQIATHCVYFDIPISQSGQQQQQQRPASNIAISNPYKLVGLDPDAPTGLIRAAKIWWNKELHPDSNGRSVIKGTTDEKALLLKVINAALSDIENKRYTKDKGAQS